MAEEVDDITLWVHHTQVRRVGARKWPSRQSPAWGKERLHWGPGPFYSLPHHLLLKRVFCTIARNTEHGLTPAALRPGLETEEDRSRESISHGCHKMKDGTRSSATTNEQPRPPWPLCTDAHSKGPVVLEKRYGNSSFETEIQNLQLYAFPVAAPVPRVPETREFPWYKLGL